MNEQTLQPSMPNNAAPEPGTPLPASMKKNDTTMTILAAVIVIVIGILIALFFAMQKPSLRPTGVTITPTAAPTPTPTRVLSPLATQSAFLAVEEAVSSLSATLQATQIQDPSLTPPTLTLPLGFP